MTVGGHIPQQTHRTSESRGAVPRAMNVDPSRRTGSAGGTREEMQLP